MVNILDDNTKTALDTWDNAAIEIYNPSNTSREVLESLFSALEDYDDDLKEVLDARHINNATGDELDKIGEIGEIDRKTGESDDKYRARIKANIVAGNSGATFQDIVNFTASILQIDTSKLDVDNDFNNAPVAVVLGVGSSAFDDTTLTEREVLDILNTLVPAGHTTILDITRGSFKLKAVAGLPQDEQITAQDLEDDGFKGLSNTQSGGSYEGGRLVGRILP